MKRVFLILITSLYFSNTYAICIKSDSTKKQLGLVVKTDILQPLINGAGFNPHYYNNIGYKIFNSFSATAEKLLKKRHSIQLTFIESWTSTTSHADDVTVSINPTVIIPTIFSSDKSHNWSLIPEYKFFISKKKAHSGYYIGAFGYFNYWYDNNNSSLYSSTQYITKQINVGGGISNGVQFYLFKRITIDALLELGAINNKPIYNNFMIINPPPPSPASVDMCGCVNEIIPIQFYYRFAINIGYKF